MEPKNPPIAGKPRNRCSFEAVGRGRQYHEIPLVRIRETPDKKVRLVETARSEWLSDAFVQQTYGVSPDRLRTFRISGNSMVGTLRPGDLVRAVLWDGYPPNDGTIVIVRGPVSFLIRRVRLLGAGVVLVADNPAVPDWTLSKEQWENDYQQIARVLEVRRAL